MEKKKKTVHNEPSWQNSILNKKFLLESECPLKIMSIKKYG